MGTYFGTPRDDNDVLANLLGDVSRPNFGVPTIGDLWHSTLQWTCYAYLFMGAVDFLWARNFLSRWFQLHCLMNAIIATLCAKDTWFVLSDPLHAIATDDASQIPLALVFALHIYHMTAPGMNLHFVDYLHHISPS